MKLRQDLFGVTKTDSSPFEELFSTGTSWLCRKTFLQWIWVCFQITPKGPPAPCEREKSEPLFSVTKNTGDYPKRATAPPIHDMQKSPASKTPGTGERSVCVGLACLKEEEAAPAPRSLFRVRQARSQSSSSSLTGSRSPSLWRLFPIISSKA